MNKSNYFSFITLVIAGVITLAMTTHTVWGQGRSSAPGQEKKETTTTSQSNKPDKENKTPPGQEKKQNVIVGSVEEVTENTVQIKENKGNKKQVEVNNQTKVMRNEKNEVKLGAIKVKDIIAVVGTEEGDTATKSGKIKVKKVFVQEASQSAQMKRKAVQGVITNVSGNVLTLAHQIHRDRTYTVVVDEATTIQSKEATGSATASLFIVGQRIVAVGDLNESGGILAKRVKIIPGKATGLFEKNPVDIQTDDDTATDSAEATPSATPTVVATVSATIAPTSVDTTPAL